MVTLTRNSANPIVLPSVVNDWEKRAAFNGSVAKYNNQFHMVYRALSSMMYYQGHSMSLSTVGHAISSDGVKFTDHKQFIKPEFPWEIYGCEDPRVTQFEGKFYIFYTALSQYPFAAPGIKVGVAVSTDMETIEEKHLVTPFNAKAMALFPERINGKIVVILAANTDMPPAKISLAFFERIEEIWSESYWKNWYAYLDDHALPLMREPKDQVEVGSVPVKTDKGWLLIYSYIRDYLTDKKQFGIEAVLLDSTDPKKVIARTSDPLLTPEMDYEKYGDVPNIVFPSGALVDSEQLLVYYGAADTSCCVASCNLSDLLNTILENRHTADVKKSDTVTLERFEENPIMRPRPTHSWEDKAVFNPAAYYDGNKIHLIYRAMSSSNLSVFGYASTTDGYHIDERLSDPVYVPREVFERNLKGGGAGCEDPRITKIDDRFYMLYTAYDGENPPRVAISSISENDFRSRSWHWAIPKLISPPDIDDKDACLFPKRIQGKYVFLHRLQSSIWIDTADDIHFYDGNYLGGKVLFEPRAGKWDSARIGIASPPIETEQGWLLLYHGISNQKEYAVGAALLKLDDPKIVLSKLDYPLLTPEMHYEREGIVGNVVFPCGAIVKDDTLFVYYGGADSVVGVATVRMDKLLGALNK